VAPPDSETAGLGTRPLREASDNQTDTSSVVEGSDRSTAAQPPGGLTAASPGQTDRVKAALGRARAKRQADQDGADRDDQHDASTAAGYGGLAWEYRRQGWLRPIPIPPPDDQDHDGKWPPPTGYTGHAGLTPSGADIQAWCEDRPGDNIAIVMSDGFIAIDVDDYGDKRGGDTIAAHEQKWGPLPAGPHATSRLDDPVSGKRFFRVPEGATFVTVLDGGGVEIIQPHHRYAVVADSLHHEGHRTVWRDGQHSIIGIPPAADMPWLPDAWVAGMFSSPSEASDDFGMVDVEDTFTAGQPDDRVIRELHNALDRLTPERRNTRYDSTLRRSLALMRLGRNGHPGVRTALLQLGEAYVDAVAADRKGGQKVAVKEYRRMLHSPGARRALAVPSHREAAQKADEEFFAAMTRERDDMTTQAEADPGPGPDPDHEAKFAENGQEPDPKSGPIGSDGSNAAGQGTGPKSDTGDCGSGSGLYVDTAAQLAGGLPDSPMPTILKRRDGHCLFYRGQVNWLFGDPECGKTWVALGAVAETLILGGRALFIDLDRNGWPAIVGRLQLMGVPIELLSSQDRFRFCDPDDGAHVRKVIEDAKQWKPDVVVVDSIGELVPLFGRDSNSADDFTKVNTNVLNPMAKTGAAVITIDHLPKNPDRRADGPAGSHAKRRTPGGVSLRVKTMKPFVPDQGGVAFLSVNKDRHGGVRRECPVGEREQPAGTFVLKAAGDIDTLTGELCWHVNAPKATDHDPDEAEAHLVTLIEQMDPPPTSIEDARKRLGVKKERAAKAYNAWKSKQDNTTENEKE